VPLVGSSDPVNVVRNQPLFFILKEP